VAGTVGAQRRGHPDGEGEEDVHSETSELAYREEVLPGIAPELERWNNVCLCCVASLHDKECQYASMQAFGCARLCVRACVSVCVSMCTSARAISLLVRFHVKNATCRRKW